MTGTQELGHLRVMNLHFCGRVGLTWFERTPEVRLPARYLIYLHPRFVSRCARDRLTPNTATSRNNVCLLRYFRVRHSHGGTGCGLTHNSFRTSLASVFIPSSAVFPGAYFRYHQRQRSLTSLRLTLVPSTSKHIDNGAPVFVVAVRLKSDCLPEGECRRGLLGSLDVGSAFLRAVDAVQADAFGVVIVQEFESVAVDHTDDLAGEVCMGVWDKDYGEKKAEKRERNMEYYGIALHTNYREHLTFNGAELAARLLFTARNFPQTFGNTVRFNCDPLIFGVCVAINRITTSHMAREGRQRKQPRALFDAVEFTLRLH